MNKWISLFHETYPAWFDSTRKNNKLAQQILTKIVVNEEDLQHLLVATLYCRVVSHFQGVITMCERGMLSEARILLRTLLEALFSLVALAEKPDLCQRFIQDDIVQRLKKVHLYKNLPKESRTRNRKRDRKLKNLGMELRKEIEHNEILPLTTERMAQEANMQDSFNSVYTLLCDTVHCRSRDLEDHLVINDKLELEGLRWGPNTEGVEEIMLAANEYLSMAMHHVINLFNMSYGTERQRIWNSLPEIS